MCERPLILAVDDDEDSLLLLFYALESLDCTILTETGGQAALNAAATQKPDLILLDIVLPDIYGVDCIRLLKQNPETQSIPIIAVTALARAEERELILLKGCDAYVSKPYMLDELEALIRCHLPCIPACSV
jgi:CheY-like chemotaxis protein